MNWEIMEPSDETLKLLSDEMKMLSGQIASYAGDIRALTVEVRETKDNLGMVEQYGRKTRRFSRALAISVAFDILLSLGLGFVGIKGLETSHQARQSVHASCMFGNDFRKKELSLWSYVLALPPSPGESQQQLDDQSQKKAQFTEFLDTTFAPRQC